MTELTKPDILNVHWSIVNQIPTSVSADKLSIVYGTNALADSLPITEILTSDEIAFAENLRGDGQKSNWLSCRATLRSILGSHLDKKASEIEFRTGRFGKLYLAGSDLFFNVGHSQHSFLLGFNPGGRIGVDIELVNLSEDLHSLVKYAFSAAETNYFMDNERLKRFSEIWTLKEAYLKAAGIGLVDDMSSISVIGESDNCITRYHLIQKSFFCPLGETGSIVYRNNKPLNFVRVI